VQSAVDDAFRQMLAERLQPVKRRGELKLIKQANEAYHESPKRRNDEKNERTHTWVASLRSGSASALP
jgi:hypothetical protein